MNNKITLIIGLTILCLALFGFILSSLKLHLVDGVWLGRVSKGLIILGGTLSLIGNIKAKAAK